MPYVALYHYFSLFVRADFWEGMVIEQDVTPRNMLGAQPIFEVCSLCDQKGSFELV